MVKEVIAPRKLLPAQKKFMQSNARYQLYSGAFAAGKTLIGCNKVILYCLQRPQDFWLVGCQTYPMLRDTVMRTFFEELDLWEKAIGHKLIKKWRKSDKHLIFYNGSEVIFRAFDDASKLKSLNLGGFYIDEATEVDYEIFKMLQGRLRKANVPSHHGLLTTNPADFANWVYQCFYKNPLPNSFVVEANTLENIYLPPEYIEDLKTSYGNEQDYYNRYLLGKWGDLKGGYEFPEQLIRACIDKNILLNNWEVDNKGIWVGGMDIGRSVDLTAIVCARLEDNAWRVRIVKTFKNTPYDVQEEFARKLLESLNFRRFNVDATGIGNMLAERLRKFSPAVKAITFTEANKEEMVLNLKRLFTNTYQNNEGDMLFLPDDEELINNIRIIKRKPTEGRHLKFEVPRDKKHGHADLFWALALAMLNTKARPAKFMFG